MKTNKIVIILGIVLLIGSPMILRSVVSQEPRVRTTIGDRLARKKPMNLVYSSGTSHVDPSDEEIMAKRQFEGPINELTVRGWPRFKVSEQPFSKISKHYNALATVDRQGAASQFAPKHVD